MYIDYILNLYLRENLKLKKKAINNRTKDLFMSKIGAAIFDSAVAIVRWRRKLY